MISFEAFNNFLINSSKYVEEYLLPYDFYGLFFLSFFNSSVSVIPTEFLLVPLVLLKPDLAIFYGFIASLSSVLGALFAWYLGYYGGRSFLKKMSFNKHKSIEEKVERHGLFVVGISGISPLPFKLFCIASGVYELDRKGLVVVSSLFRGFRFMGIALLISWFGDPAVSFISSNLTKVLISISSFVFLGYYLHLKEISFSNIFRSRMV